MYLEYWKLNQAPFGNVPSGRMFYRSPQHEEALRRLLYVIDNRKGVSMLTGEVGCGKTTVIKALAAHLEKTAVQLHLITNPSLPPAELLQAILLKLGGKGENGSKALMLHQLQKILARQAAAGFSTVLVIDEAHMIENRATLDELRMLLNFQAEDQFLVTLILLGQPPLLKTISELRPLKERIAIQFNLEPLDLTSTLGYVLFRLKSAGATRSLFTQQAFLLLHELSGGNPLRINNLCDRCLLLGVMHKARILDCRILVHAIEDMEK